MAFIDFAGLACTSNTYLRLTMQDVAFALLAANHSYDDLLLIEFANISEYCALNFTNHVEDIARSQDIDFNATEYA